MRSGLKFGQGSVQIHIYHYVFPEQYPIQVLDSLTQILVAQLLFATTHAVQLARIWLKFIQLNIAKPFQL